METPLQTLLGLAPTTYKQLLETKILQKHVRNQTCKQKWVRKNYKILKQMQKKKNWYTFSLVQWATMPWLEEAPLFISWQWRSCGSIRE